eukprot:773501-Rhodomonas_salina.1
MLELWSARSPEQLLSVSRSATATQSFSPRARVRRGQRGLRGWKGKRPEGFGLRKGHAWLSLPLARRALGGL